MLSRPVVDGIETLRDGLQELYRPLRAPMVDAEHTAWDRHILPSIRSTEVHDRRALGVSLINSVLGIGKIACIFQSNNLLQADRYG